MKLIEEIRILQEEKKQEIKLKVSNYCTTSITIITVWALIRMMLY